LCFGRHLKQFHGSDVYILARNDAARMPGDTHALLMEGGDICAALNPPKPRSVKLNFACKSNAATPQLTSISETSTCFYEVQIATDRVCSDDSYPVLPDNFVVNNGRGPGAAPGPLDTGSEDWYVEISELDAPANADGSAAASQDPIVMCQAYSLEYRATSVTNLRFAQSELRITKLQGSTASHRSDVEQLPQPYRGYTARAPGRVDVDPKFLTLGYGVLALDEQAAAEYEGSLSFLKIYA
jgi:hypothetical protein